MRTNKNGNGSKKPQKTKAVKFGKSVREYIRSWDQFGHPVALSLGGEDTYKTFYGSIATFLLAAYMAYVLYV